MTDEEEGRIQAAADKLLDDKLTASSTLSTQVRTVSLGVIGLVWLILSGMQPGLLSTFSQFSTCLFVLAVAAVVVLLLDMGQATAAYLSSEEAIGRAESADLASEVHHNQKLLAYRVAHWCFVGKVSLALVTTLSLLLLVAYALIRYPPQGGEAKTAPAPATVILQFVDCQPSVSRGRGVPSADGAAKVSPAVDYPAPAPR